MKKRITAFLLTVAMGLTAFCVPALAADDTYGEYDPANGSVHVVSTDPNLMENTEYLMVAIAAPSGRMVTAKPGTTDANGHLDFTIANVGTISTDPTVLATWKVIIRENQGGVATQGPLKLKTDTPIPPISKPLTDVSIADLSMKVGDTGKPTISRIPADATTGTYAASNWRSDNDDIATVAEDGTVTAVAKGTAVISVDISISGGAAVTKTFTVTVTSNSSGGSSSGGGGGGGASSSSSTVTIASDSNSIKADVKISGGTAAIGKADKLDKVIGDGVVSIDLSKEKKDIDTVKVDSSIVNAIANDEDSKGMEIKLSDGTVVLDADAVAALKGGDLTVKLDKTNGLNSKQKDAVKDMDVHANYELTVNGTKALKDGKVEVKIPFAVPGDKDADGFRLYFVAEDGTAEAVSARFTGGEVRFTAEAFGDYVIAYKAAAPAEPAENMPVAADCDGGSGCPAHKFTDVDTSLWYHKAVDYAITNSLMSGVGENTFSPNANLSRAMLAQILYNLAGRPAVTGTSAFNDVAEGMWYTDAIAWATSEGVVSGYGNGKFGPNDNITREQLAVMLYRYAGSPAAGGSLDGFADAGKVSGYAQNALVWATGNGVMSGKGGGMLDPQGLATRAEVAQMLYNYLNK